MDNVLMEDTPATSLEDLRTRLLDVLDSNHRAVSRFGARLIVHDGFAESVLPCLSPAQCKEIERRFRLRVEHLMSYTDDVAMPGEYHDSLLDETNDLLKALRSASAGELS
jgi:hypothetical protein